MILGGSRGLAGALLALAVACGGCRAAPAPPLSEPREPARVDVRDEGEESLDLAEVHARIEAAEAAFRAIDLARLEAPAALEREAVGRGLLADARAALEEGELAVAADLAEKARLVAVDLAGGSRG